MTLAPLTTGPHLVPANRLAFTTPVREAGGAGHWITLHAEDSDSGTCHVWVNGGSGPGSGTITKGPKGLLHQHIAALASHPSVSKAQHHPVGHEPPGARDHPHYAEAAPKPPVAPGEAGSGEAVKRPGKPYARLSGAEQGTRAEQIGKALSEAQGAAKGAKAAQGQQSARAAYRALGSEAWSPQTRAEVQGTQLTDAHRAFFREHPHILDTVRQSVGPEHFATKAPSLASTSSTRTRLSPEENARRFKDYQDVKALGFLHHEKGIQPRIRGSLWTHGQKFLQEQHEAGKGETQPEGARRATGFDNPVSATARMADKSAAAAEKSGGRLTDMAAAKEQLRAKVDAARAAKAARQQTDVADTAVAHQQAQADLAAHRASRDRNPNPWAPHLSPPVGDAKDRELAEKATRAQLAHQAVVAQQQGQAQAEQAEGQRAHEKEMVRLKAPRQQQQSTPGHTLESVSADVERHKAHVLDEHPDLKAFLAHAEQHNVARPKRFEERIDTQHHEKWLATEARARLSSEQRKAAGIPERMAQRFAKPAVPSPATSKAEPTPAFSAPGAKETPQTAPQPEQPAHPYEGEAHEHVAALPQAVRDTLTKAGVKVQQHQGSQAEALPGHGVSTPMAKLGPADAGYDSRTGTAHFFGGKVQRYDVHHEMGHAFDDALGYQATGKHHTPSSSLPAFQALYHKHKENMDLPPPMRTSPSEMFADAFAMHHDVLHQEGETADGEPRMVHRGRKLERAAPDLRAHIAALSEQPPGRKVRESTAPAARFSAPAAC